MGLTVVNAGDYPVFHLDGGGDPVGQIFGVEQVPDPNTVARDLVHVCRADTLAGGSNRAAAPSLFLQGVQDDVVGHDDVGAVADEQAIGVDALFAKAGHFSQENIWVDDHSVSDNADDAGPTNARRDQVQLEHAAIVYYGVSGVVSARVANDAIGLAGKVINDPSPCLRLPTDPRLRRKPALFFAPDISELSADTRQWRGQRPICGLHKMGGAQPPAAV